MDFKGYYCFVLIIVSLSAYRTTSALEKPSESSESEAESDTNEEDKKENKISLKRYYEQYVQHHIYGHCKLNPNTADVDNQQLVTGSVDFRQSLKGGATEIRLNLTGFVKEDKVNKHGLHVHEYGDLSAGCSSAGGHYNPFDVIHGSPHDSPEYRHFGDLGNIAEDSEGGVTATTKDLLVSLLGPFSVLGRAVVLHKLEDDLGRGATLESLRTGNAGPRIACCTIGLSDGTRWK